MLQRHVSALDRQPAPERATVAANTRAAEDLDAAFARFLRLDVANGDASVDTIRSYRSQLAAWVSWCADQNIDARTAIVDDVKRYREDLVAQGRQATTISHKLNVLRRVYAAAVAAGLRADNPATGVRAPRDRRGPEDFGYLSEVELALLFRAVPHDDELKHLRDRALLGLLGLQALRTVEITRGNVDDLQRHGDNWALLVHGKYHDRLVFLRPDVADAVRAYLAARGTIAPDEFGEALIVAEGNFARGHRLSRRGVPSRRRRLPTRGQREATPSVQPCAAPYQCHAGLSLHTRSPRRSGHARPPGSENHRSLRTCRRSRPEQSGA
jgi:site-specific recombinase XerD